LIEGWPDPAGDLPADLADVADLFAQVGEPARALATYRILAKQSPTGSPRWFVAKLGQARSLFASGQVDAAKTLVEGTTLLHPDLGGPVMKASFEALRTKLSRR